MAISFAASPSTVGTDDDQPGITLKISCVECEMNVWLALAELPILDRVLATPWEGGALKLGTSASADAWWSCDNGFVLVAAGHDDQAWDFGLRFPVAQFADLRAAIAEELKKHAAEARLRE